MKTFDELDLIEPLKRALAQQEYTTPTPIQAQTIPAALERRDVLGCAQTGTGKTAAFALPILNRLGQQNRKAKPHRPFALILAPTRELAIQIGQSFETYGRHLKLRCCLVYGGVGQAAQVQRMQRGSHVLVATPGRLLDLMDQGHIQLDQLEVFVLDEADRMLDMGFMPDLKRIIRKLPEDRQSLFFSATMAPSIIELTERLLVDPISVNVTPKTRSVERIEQRLIYVRRKAKQDLLDRILSQREVERAIVFTKTKRTANFVTAKLGNAGIKAAAIHGNKSQNARQRALDAFRKKFVQVLVATDVAARGIDIDGVTHVINFDLPMEPEAYVHRIGRTGRAGAEGIAISFCSEGDRSDLQAIERLIRQAIPIDKNLSTEIPSGGETKSRPAQRGGRGGQGSRGRSNAGKPRSGSGSSRRSGLSSHNEESSSEGKRPTKRRQRRNRQSGGANSASSSNESSRSRSSAQSNPRRGGSGSSSESSQVRSSSPSRSRGSSAGSRSGASESSATSSRPKRKRAPRKGKNERMKSKRNDG
ncbi:MAG: DEAD/DEAH box helicase [Mariniblastus sp.]